MSSSAPNSVDVDQAVIDDSLNALGARVLESESQQPPTAADVPESARLAVDWSQALDGAMQLLAKVVLPNWQLTDVEQQITVDQGSKILEAFFPNFVIEGKWLVLFSGTLCIGGIVGKRFDLDTLAFKPGRLTPTPEPEPEPVKPPQSAASRYRDQTAQAAAAVRSDRVVATPWVAHGS